MPQSGDPEGNCAQSSALNSVTRSACQYGRGAYDRLAVQSVASGLPRPIYLNVSRHFPGQEPSTQPPRATDAQWQVTGRENSKTLRGTARSLALVARASFFRISACTRWLTTGSSVLISALRIRCAITTPRRQLSAAGGLPGRGARCASRP